MMRGPYAARVESCIGPDVMTYDCRDRLLFRNGLARRWGGGRLQFHIDRVRSELRRALGLAHRYGLRLVSIECQRHRQLAARLNGELTGRTTALSSRGFRLSARRLGFDRQRFGLRSRLEKVQARH